MTVGRLFPTHAFVTGVCGRPDRRKIGNRSLTPFPISNPHYTGDDDEQGYIDYITTEGYRLRATGLKSITIKGSCCVPVELVENWGLDATESAVASSEFFVERFELEK
jgi:hypothetical protein